MGVLMSQPEDLPSEEEDQEVSAEGQGRYTCKYCGQSFPSINLLGTHSKTCPERKKALEMAASKTEPIYKTEGDANTILEEILVKHPDITPRIREEIMDWARLKGFLQPMEVQQIIQSFRGVSQATAQIIAAKYAFALQKAMSEGRLTIPYPQVVPPPQPPQPTPILPPFTPQPQPPTYQLQPSSPSISPPPSIPIQQQSTLPWLQPPQTFPPQQPQTYPQYDVRSLIRDELRYLEEKLKPTKEQEVYVEIERPVRLPDGRVVLGPDDKPIFEKMKVPVSQAHLFMKETPEATLREEIRSLREELRNREIEALREEIQELKRMREEPAPQTQVPPEELVDKAVKKVLEEKEKEKREEERFARLERAIREAATAKAVEGYKEDSYRILGQGLSEVASVVRERKPIEVIIREGGQLLLGSPPPKEVEAGAEPESILERLKKRGWVTEE